MKFSHILWIHLYKNFIICCSLIWFVEKMDVKFAFLYGDSDEKIYMKQPRDFIKKRNENLVCLLKKSLNSLK